MSVTTRCRPWSEPGVACVMPVPIAIEHAEPGVSAARPGSRRRRCGRRRRSKPACRLERLGAVHVRDGDHDELELPVHVRSPWCVIGLVADALEGETSTARKLIGPPMNRLFSIGSGVLSSVRTTPAAEANPDAVNTPADLRIDPARRSRLAPRRLYAGRRAIRLSGGQRINRPRGGHRGAGLLEPDRDHQSALPDQRPGAGHPARHRGRRHPARRDHAAARNAHDRGRGQPGRGAGVAVRRLWRRPDRRGRARLLCTGR